MQLTETALADLLAAALSGLDLVAVMIGGANAAAYAGPAPADTGERQPRAPGARSSSMSRST